MPQDKLSSSFYANAISGYQSNEKLQEYTQHNHFFWRCVQGGLSLVREYPFGFDPIESYWYRGERRVLVAYFTQRFGARFVPAAALRRLAFLVFRHFDEARSSGRIKDTTGTTYEPGRWPSFCDTLVQIAEDLPEFEEYRQLREVWADRLVSEYFREDLRTFVEQAKKQGIGKLERTFFRRLAWFPYLGLDSLDKLVDRQRFFYGFYQLFSSTNSYSRGGGLVFAPVLQNNPTDKLVGFVERWVEGETPHETEFMVEAKATITDKSNAMPVVELYGFLNLHEVPFYNGVTRDAYDTLAKASDTSVYDRMKRIGQRTKEFLHENPERVAWLAGEFMRLVESRDQGPTLLMEGIGKKSVRKLHPDEVKAQVENKLVPELEQGAMTRASSFDELEAATAMMHLLLDAAIYGHKKSLEPSLDGDNEKPPRPQGEAVLRLPATLRANADDALGYLHAGHHVLFAGPPGTGKTTLAQLVGHAWNKDLLSVQDEIPIAEAPETTVGNSAWAPFHTIGGLLPRMKGGFEARPGIFIDPKEMAGDTWQLRGDCVVLDEMNRADLDRCIGELYPLLSRSVEYVFPAGIPGVRRIRTHSRFRIVATINDATLDDIVFPISEGLARRFVRIELVGASLDDLRDFLRSADDVDEQRFTAAWDVIETLHELCDKGKLLTETDDGEHLPFGAGYFSTMRSWIENRLTLSTLFQDQELLEQARILPKTSLTGAVRLRGMESILDQLDESEEIP